MLYGDHYEHSSVSSEERHQMAVGPQTMLTNLGHESAWRLVASTLNHRYLVSILKSKADSHIYNVQQRVEGRIELGCNRRMRKTYFYWTIAEIFFY